MHCVHGVGTGLCVGCIYNSLVTSQMSLQQMRLKEGVD